MNVYKTTGTCSTEIHFEIENDIITACSFRRGCVGNTQGLSRMVIGRRIDDVVALLSGIQCQNGTSCPDQLTKALLAHRSATHAATAL